jgi:hypothetical protein
MRVKAHSFFNPKDYNSDSLREMKEEVYSLILKSLKKDSI